MGSSPTVSTIVCPISALHSDIFLLRISYFRSTYSIFKDVIFLEELKNIMKTGIEEARRTMNEGMGGPFGAVTVKDGNVIAVAQYRAEVTRSHRLIAK